MITLPYCWILYPNLVFFYFLIIFSWKINNNKCLITELESYLFNETFLRNEKNFVVPRKHRNILYINTILGSTYLFLLESNKLAFLKLLPN